MGMFDVFTDVIEDGFDVVGDMLDGELPQSRQIASLISAGLTISAISEMTGVAENVISEMMNDE